MKMNTSRRRSSRASRAISSRVGPSLIQNSAFRIQNSFRVGLGTDVHRLVRGRKLVLAGVRVPFEKGPLGHSDGDALSHAICDALLGAAGLGDIGRHFPDRSPQWHNASSLLFLRRVRKLLAGAGFTIANVDATVELERPRLAPYISRMSKKLAAILGMKPLQVSVKAKSGEGLGAVGRGEAVRANAVALLVAAGSSRQARP